MLYIIAALALISVPTFAAEAPRARDVILMMSDGCGFHGWLAADYYEGRAGTHSNWERLGRKLRGRHRHIPRHEHGVRR